MQVEKHPFQVATEKKIWLEFCHPRTVWLLQDISIFGTKLFPPISPFLNLSPTCISAANSSSASSTSNSSGLWPTSCASLSRGWTWWTSKMTPRWLTDWQIDKIRRTMFSIMFSLHLHCLPFVSKATTSQAPVLPQVKPSLVAWTCCLQMTAWWEWVLSKSEIGMGHQNWASWSYDVKLQACFLLHVLHISWAQSTFIRLHFKQSFFKESNTQSWIFVSCSTAHLTDWGGIGCNKPTAFVSFQNLKPYDLQLPKAP